MSLALAAKKGLWGTWSIDSKGISISPRWVMWPEKVVPNFSRSHLRATAPAATIGAVRRADERSPPRGSRKPYLRQ